MLYCTPNRHLKVCRKILWFPCFPCFSWPRKLEKTNENKKNKKARKCHTLSDTQYITQKQTHNVSPTFNLVDIVKEEMAEEKQFYKRSERGIFDNFERLLRASRDMSKIKSFLFRNFLSGQRAVVVEVRASSTCSHLLISIWEGSTIHLLAWPASSWFYKILK